MPVFCGDSNKEEGDQWIRLLKLLKYDCNSGDMEIFQSHVLEKIFQNLHVRLKFSIR